MQPSTRTVLPYRVVALAYAGWGLCVSLGETIIGGLDALDDVSAMSDHGGRIAATGLLHLAGAMLLAVALVGIGALVRGSALGRIGWVLMLVAVPCAGAFAMLHMIALEAAAPGLDEAAMEQFLVERLGAGAGVWVVPIFIAALVAPFAQGLLLIGLARCRVASWAAPGLVLLGAVLHAVLPGEAGEVASHWIMAAGVVLAAYGIWRLGHRSRRDDAQVPEQALAT